MSEPRKRNSTGTARTEDHSLPMSYGGQNRITTFCRAVRRIEKRLEKLGYDFPEFWEQPVDNIWRLSVMTTTEMLSDPASSNQDKLGALGRAHQIYGLAAMTAIKSQQDFKQDFQKRFAEDKKDTVDAEVIEDPVDP